MIYADKHSNLGISVLGSLPSNPNRTLSLIKNPLRNTSKYQSSPKDRVTTSSNHNEVGLPFVSLSYESPGWRVCTSFMPYLPLGKDLVNSFARALRHFFSIS